MGREDYKKGEEGWSYNTESVGWSLIRFVEERSCNVSYTGAEPCHVKEKGRLAPKPHFVRARRNLQIIAETIIFFV